MPWHTFTISVQQNIAGDQARIQDIFFPVYFSNAENPRYALFSALHPRDRSITFWVSPEMSAALPAVVSKWNGIECDPPTQQMRGIRVLLGSPESILLLPPGEENEDLEPDPPIYPRDSE